MNHKYPDDLFGVPFESKATLPFPKEAIKKFLEDAPIDMEFTDTTLHLGYLENEPWMVAQEALTDNPDTTHAAVIYCIDVEPEDAIEILKKHGYHSDDGILDHPLAGITVNMVADGLLGITQDVDWEHVAVLRSKEEIEEWASAHSYPETHKIQASQVFSHALRNPEFREHVITALATIIKQHLNHKK